MILADFPYLHFMTHVHSKQGEEGLITIAEADPSDASPGVFVVPVDAGGEFFPFYRFQFAIYRGAGVFEETRGERAIHEGIAVAQLSSGRSGSLVCTFSLNEIDHVDDLTSEEFEFPVFERIPKQPPLRYVGEFTHHDFERPFAKLQLSDPQSLDVLLDLTGISLIGCEVDEPEEPEDVPRAESQPSPETVR